MLRLLWKLDTTNQLLSFLLLCLLYFSFRPFFTIEPYLFHLLHYLHLHHFLRLHIFLPSLKYSSLFHPLFLPSSSSLIKSPTHPSFFPPNNCMVKEGRNGWRRRTPDKVPQQFLSSSSAVHHQLPATMLSQVQESARRGGARVPRDSDSCSSSEHEADTTPILFFIFFTFEIVPKLKILFTLFSHFSGGGCRERIFSIFHFFALVCGCYGKPKTLSCILKSEKTKIPDKA